MSNDDERDYEEERANQALLDSGDDELAGYEPFGGEQPDQEAWFFTFGVSGRLVAHNPDIAFDGDQEGIPLVNYYVRATGTYEEARAKMVKRFATCWAFQYSTAQFGPLLSKHHYKQLLDL
jgi:hypothetical protein